VLIVDCGVVSGAVHFSQDDGVINVSGWTVACDESVANDQD
jgi:hypothetical protein